MISSPQIWPVELLLSSLYMCPFYMTPLSSISILGCHMIFQTVVPNHLVYKNHPCFQRSVAYPEKSLGIKIWPLEHHCLSLSVERVGIYLCMLQVYSFSICIHTDNFEFTLRLQFQAKYPWFIPVSSLSMLPSLSYRKKPWLLLFYYPYI